MMRRYNERITFTLRCLDKILDKLPKRKIGGRIRDGHFYRYQKSQARTSQAYKMRKLFRVG